MRNFVYQNFKIMAQITINIEDTSILPSLRKVLESIPGVSIVKPQSKKKKCGLDKALDDAKQGRVNHYDSVEHMFQSLGI